MTNQEVRWWLLGFFELCDKPLDKKMLFIIKNHLHLVKAVEGELDIVNTIIYEKVEALLEYNTSNALSTFHTQLKNTLIEELRVEIR